MKITSKKSEGFGHAFWLVSQLIKLIAIFYPALILRKISTSEGGGVSGIARGEDCRDC